LYGATSMEEAQERIKVFRRKHIGSGRWYHWLRGVGWDQDRLGRWPTAVSLLLPLLPLPHASKRLHPWLCQVADRITGRP
jgi:hypothetical protein